jgi:hypothetical protein
VKHDDFIKTLKTLKANFTPKQTQKTFTPPHEEHTQNRHCLCKDSTGESKYLYTSKEELEYQLSSRSVKLKSYPCPYEKGWHITKI